MFSMIVADLSKEGDRVQHRPFPQAYFNHPKLGDDARGDARAFVKGFDITMMNKPGPVFQRVGSFLDLKTYTVFRAIGELKRMFNSWLDVSLTACSVYLSLLCLFVTPPPICHSPTYLSPLTYLSLLRSDTYLVTLQTAKNKTSIFAAN